MFLSFALSAFVAGDSKYFIIGVGLLQEGETYLNFVICPILLS